MRKLQSQGVHHITVTVADPQTYIALSVSAATFQQAVDRLDERGISTATVKERSHG
ncbi:MAG TPA: hypothetical protein VF052_05585 [Solirubrobacterales bacterium]